MRLNINCVKRAREKDRLRKDHKEAPLSQNGACNDDTGIKNNNKCPLRNHKLFILHIEHYYKVEIWYFT